MERWRLEGDLTSILHSDYIEGFYRSASKRNRLYAIPFIRVINSY